MYGVDMNAENSLLNRVRHTGAALLIGIFGLGCGAYATCRTMEKQQRQQEQQYPHESGIAEFRGRIYDTDGDRKPDIMGLKNSSGSIEFYWLERMEPSDGENHEMPILQSRL